MPPRSATTLSRAVGPRSAALRQCPRDPQRARPCSAPSGELPVRAARHRPLEERTRDDRSDRHPRQSRVLGRKAPRCVQAHHGRARRRSVRGRPVAAAAFGEEAKTVVVRCAVLGAVAVPAIGREPKRSPRVACKAASARPARSQSAVAGAVVFTDTDLSCTKRCK